MSRHQERDSYPAELDGNCDHCGLFTRRRYVCRCGAKTCGRCIEFGGSRCKGCRKYPPLETSSPRAEIPRGPVMTTEEIFHRYHYDAEFHALCHRIMDGIGACGLSAEDLEGVAAFAFRLKLFRTQEKSKLTNSGDDR